MIDASHWSVVDGGRVASGCGALLPAAHGKSLYFDGCGRRQAVTAELDLTTARCGDISLVIYLALSYPLELHFAISEL